MNEQQEEFSEKDKRRRIFLITFQDCIHEEWKTPCRIFTYQEALVALYVAELAGASNARIEKGA